MAPDEDAQPVLTVTDKAKAKVLAARAEEPDGETLALWLEVIGVRGGDFAYDLYFQGAEHADPDDVVQVDDDLTVVVPADSVELVRGATLDLNRDLLNPGMVVKNPNRPPAPPAPASPMIEDGEPLELSGDVPDRIRQVLDQRINPAIAAHGGQAELVAVEDDVAYLRLGGGCVGCGMAAVTLTQGIQVAIIEAVPEITRVVDVTDHAAGTNPYYEAAKK